MGLVISELLKIERDFAHKLIESKQEINQQLEDAKEHLHDEIHEKEKSEKARIDFELQELQEELNVAYTQYLLTSQQQMETLKQKTESRINKTLRELTNLFSRERM